MLRVMRQASKVIKMDVGNLDNYYNKTVLNKLDKIVKDVSHPMNYIYCFNKSGRLRPISNNSSRFRNSFFNNSVFLFNSNFKR